jgi:DNA repair protein REV1
METPLGTPSSDLFESQDTEFLAALSKAVLPGDDVEQTLGASEDSQISSDHPPTPPCTQPCLKRPRSPSPPPTSHSSIFPRLAKSSEERPEVDQAIYGASRFGEYGEYMRRKRAKLQIQNVEMDGGDEGRIFHGLQIYVCSIYDPPPS